MKIEFEKGMTLVITPENHAEDIALKAWLNSDGSGGHGLLMINGDWDERKESNER